MLKVQEFLLSFESYNEAVKSLNEKYGVVVKEYDDLIMLNYSQIDSPRFNELSDDCRGLILSKDFKTIYSRPFTRFYNYGEGNKKDFDFSNSCIMSKLDGSLMMLWYHPIHNLWFVSSRKMAYAEGVTVFGSTYRKLFMKCFNIDEEISDVDFTSYINNLIGDYKDYTFIFEMTSPENRVVTPYKDYKVHLLGVRSTNPSLEKSYLDIKKFSNYFNLPKMYNFNNIDDIMLSMKELEPLEEGYVCYDSENELRIKVKSPAYVAIHHLRDNGINLNKICFLVFENEYEEYLSYFPDDRHLFEPYIKAYSLFNDEVNKTFDLYNKLENQKEFALSVGKFPFSSILFEMRKGKSFNEVCSKLNDDRKLKYLNMFVDEKLKNMSSKKK